MGLAAVAVAAALLGLAGAGAERATAVVVIGPKGGGPLSPGLTQLSEAPLRASSAAAQATALGLPAAGPGSLIREGRRLLADVRFEEGAIARLRALRAAGARVVASSRSLQTVTVSVAPAALEPLARVLGVAAVSPVRAPLTRAPTECQGGSVISEGVGQLGVEVMRDEPGFGFEGDGITVGVLSDSFDVATEAAGGGPIATDATADVESKDLPGPANLCVDQEDPVEVLDELDPEPGRSGSDEGRAMLQIVHDIAPRARLAFASAFNGELAFAENIEALADGGPGGADADVVVDDVIYFGEPMFQEGPVAVAATNVSAAGVPFVSAAGNDNLFDAEGNEIASWEAPAFRDSGGCPAAIAADPALGPSDCLDFDPSARTDRTFGVRVEPGEVLSVDLQWAEPWNGVSTDLDAFLLDVDGRLLGAGIEDNLAIQRPVEILQWENTAGVERVVQLVVNRFTGAAPRVKLALLQNGGGVSGTEYPRSGGGDVVGPMIFGHAGAEAAIAVAAVPYYNASTVEPFSSRGPVTHLFGPVEGTLPAPMLPSPEVVSKPDVAATDCAATTFFAFIGSGGKWRFCGTSAAAPHAAGVAALALEAEPGASPAQVEAALAGTGAPVGAFGPCAAGGGLVATLAALEVVRGEASPVAPGVCGPPNSAGPVFLAPGFWGHENAPPAPPAPLPAPQPQLSPAPSPPPVADPKTRIAKRPAKVVRTRQRSVRLVFRFASDQAGTRFLCKVDRRAFLPCARKFSRRYGLGRHVVRVKARNRDGATDRTPATFRFRVVRIR
jgi:hypothetical protein